MSNSTFFLAIGKWSTNLLTIEILYKLSLLLYHKLKNNKNFDLTTVLEKIKIHFIIYIVLTAALMCTEESIYGYEFVIFVCAYLVYKSPEIFQEAKATVTYGTGMACSFVEGYLVHVIPNDGADFVGVVRNIDRYEATQGIVFPVKRLFIVCTKSLFCPPDLCEFNKMNKDLPYLEAMKSLDDVKKDVAGVKNRPYRNSAYKIYRPAGPPVHLVVECATPLHTLYKARSRRVLSDVLDNVNPQEVVEDFCNTLETLVKTPEYEGKCEIVYFDDKTEYLPNVLLERIRKLEPDFENIIKGPK